MRPLIGISCSMGQAIYSFTQDNPPQLQHRMNDSYIKAVTQAGGIPVILPNNTDVSCVEEIATKLDGFLLSGGDDVDPVKVCSSIILVAIPTKTNDKFV